MREGPIRTANLATRAQLATMIIELSRRPGRTLIVIDVALGWPLHVATALGVKGRSGVVALLNELIRDDEDNSNNRFEVASELNRRAGQALWWGHPRTQRYPFLSMNTRAPEGLAPRHGDAMRLIERHVGGVIKSPLQLTGIGAVGSQSILAQVMIERLRERGVEIAVWPFDEATAPVVIGEYFFSLAPWRDERGLFTDQRQVRAVARWVRRSLDEGRDVASPSLLDSLTTKQRRIVLHDEGWLVGWNSAKG